MFHVYGLTTCLIAPVLCGAAILPQTRFRVDHLLDTILRHRPSILPLVPVIIDAICNRLEHDPKLCSAVADAVAHRVVTSGAARLLPASGRRFEQLLGVPVIQGYGLTEASPITHVNVPGEPRDGSIGVPLPDTLIRIVDLHDPNQDAAPGEPGEMLISGPQVMKGYFNDEAATRSMMTVDDEGRRWLHTGDVVKTDKDGFYYVVDRKKDMINRGGLKVWPDKVERALVRHPSVSDAAVVGREDGAYDEMVVGVVVLEEPASDLEKLVAELQTHCRKYLAPYEVPSRIEVVDELPRSGLGKLLKYRLKSAEQPSNEDPPDSKSDDDLPAAEESSPAGSASEAQLA